MQGLLYFGYNINNVNEFKISISIVFTSMKSIDIDSTRWRGSVFTVFFLYPGLPSLTGFTKFTSLLIPGLLPGLPGVITAVPVYQVLKVLYLLTLTPTRQHILKPTP